MEILIQILKGVNDFFNVAPDASLAIAWWVLPAAIGGANMLKNKFVDEPQQQKMANLRAAEVMSMPWNGRQAPTTEIPQTAGLLGSALQGGAMGLSAYQSLNNAGILNKNKVGLGTTNPFSTLDSGMFSQNQFTSQMPMKQGQGSFNLLSQFQNNPLYRGY